MYVLKQTETYLRWFRRLRDRKGKATITAKVARLANGASVDTKSVGGDVYELRIHIGPGYRVYYMKRGDSLIILLCGGDKGTQVRDIAAAKRIAAGWTDDDEDDED
ncbi:type II toxin-antitoxin system RelE/ParE family toxin [Pelagibius sp. Alg239-R121]|uniref:type II toxin-antitoxin system RelE/ParE family toxin n=1 Tax=Pelagibius sp. Alg239-R121 TaxID=2993448 RepID=UPI0024A684A4|nr:type II toxin-antitoxin system RelE/ParE family toxin [Pelagibius sp. Alg239-R121]